MEPESRLEKSALCLAVLYVLLLAFPYALGERAFLHDALVPAMALVVALRHRNILQRFGHFLRNILGKQEYVSGNEHVDSFGIRFFLPLALFLVGALTVTCVHGWHAHSDFYEWCVFAYMGVLFAFYAETTVSDAVCGKASMAIFGVVLLAFVYECLPLPGRFSFISTQMDSTDMTFLSRRFAFTMGNPNIFGVFYAIPCALATRAVAAHDWSNYSVARRFMVFPIMFLLMLPIMSSASKHGILSAALMLSWPSLVFPKWRNLLRTGAFCMIVCLVIVFETTVLFITFPLKSQPPFVTTEPGMYTLHQTTYARMLIHQPTRLLLGTGAHDARQLYRHYSDREQIGKTLPTYNAMASYDNFITFMDPHNEYLNLMTLFGLPVAILAVLFWLLLPRHAQHRLRTSAWFFVIAVLASALWDDLFSKRHLWLAAALLVPNPFLQQKNGTQSDKAGQDNQSD